MNNNDIKSYIEKLKSIESQLSGDSIDSSFMTELEQVLSKLNTDVKDHMTDDMFDINVKYKKLYKDSVEPKYANFGDAGMDLTVHSIIDNPSQSVTYGFGIAMEIPPSHVGLLFPRSSVRKFDIILSNCVGVIDCTYRGEIQATFKKINGYESIYYDEGDRAVQMIIIPYPRVKLTESETLSDTERGSNGFGSTGL